MTRRCAEMLWNYGSDYTSADSMWCSPVIRNALEQCDYVFKGLAVPCAKYTHPVLTFVEDFEVSQACSTVGTQIENQGRTLVSKRCRHVGQKAQSLKFPGGIPGQKCLLHGGKRGFAAPPWGSCVIRSLQISFQILRVSMGPNTPPTPSKSALRIIMNKSISKKRCKKLFKRRPNGVSIHPPSDQNKLKNQQNCRKT